jgi:hypothetical protein
LAITVAILSLSPTATPIRTTLAINYVSDYRLLRASVFYIESSLCLILFIR